jgi:HEAT repeats/Putative zinc-finger
MKCEDMEPLMIDYLDMNLAPDKTGEIERHLETCEKCLDDLRDLKEILQLISKEEMKKPDDSMRINFYHMLHSEIKRNETGSKAAVKESHVPWYGRSIYRIAAGFALLIAGTLIGVVFYSLVARSGQMKEIAGMKSEINSLKVNSIFAMLKNESSSYRIQAVNYAEEIDAPDENIINALVETLNNDKNVNVRMTAAFALSKFTSQRSVCDSLVSSLQRQEDPILQVTLINILVGIGEKNAIKPIERIISDDNTLDEVRSLAERGVKMLI